MFALNVQVDESMGSKFKQWEETERNDEEWSRGGSGYSRVYAIFFSTTTR